MRGAVGGVVTVHHGHMPEIDVTSPTTATGTWAMAVLDWSASLPPRSSTALPDLRQSPAASAVTLGRDS